MTVKDIVAVSDQRHGGPFDRGSADSHYHRGIRPHYYMGATGASDIVYPEPGTAEHEAYMTGYEYNEQHGDKKDWN